MIKKAKILTLIFHSCIVFGAGHGIGILLILDILVIPSLIERGLEFNLNGEFSDRLGISGLFSLIGKLFVISSFFIKRKLIKNLACIFGLILLWCSIYLLTSGDWQYDSMYRGVFVFSIPFLVCSIALTVLFAREYLIKETRTDNEDIKSKKASL